MNRSVYGFIHTSNGSLIGTPSPEFPRNRRWILHLECWEGHGSAAMHDIQWTHPAQGARCPHGNGKACVKSMTFARHFAKGRFLRSTGWSLWIWIFTWHRCWLFHKSELVLFYFVKQPGLTIFLKPNCSSQRSAENWSTNASKLTWLSCALSGIGQTEWAWPSASRVEGCISRTWKVLKGFQSPSKWHYNLLIGTEQTMENTNETIRYHEST